MEHFIQLYKLLRRLCKRSFVQVDKIPCARFAFLLSLPGITRPPIES